MIVLKFQGLKEIGKETGSIFLLAYIASFVLLPIVFMKGWWGNPLPLFLFPVTVASFVLSLWIGTGALLTIPAGLAVSKGLKRDVTPLISLKGERTSEIMVWSLVFAFLLFFTMIATGLIGYLAGEPFPNIESLFFIPLSAAEVDPSWIVALVCFAFLSSITEEATFRLFGISGLKRLFDMKIGEVKGWYLAIAVTSLTFMLYHFQMEMWQETVSSTAFRTLISGLILGYLFKRQGFEACIFSHTMSNVWGFIVLAFI